MRTLCLLFLLGTFAACTPAPESETVVGDAPAAQTVALSKTVPAVTGPADMDAFGDYWYQGQAELTSYTLEQARYGEIHPGHAVLVYVTEDFSKSKQVKLDRPSEAGDDRAKVLKVNFTKKFNTGVYPYSTMTSVFTPVYRKRNPHTLKVTTTSQEWCGHTFVQLNRNEAGYALESRSYFESEGDINAQLPDVALEDDIWTTLRLNPDDLPTGEFQMIPGTLYQRLGHKGAEAQSATATLTTGGNGQTAYTLTYPEHGRTLTINFNAAFPYEIESWEESYPSGFGLGAKVLTTKAQRNKRIMLDYWSRNGLEDAQYRETLGLP